MDDNLNLTPPSESANSQNPQPNAQYNQNSSGGNTYSNPQPSNPFATASMVMGIVSVACVILIFPIILAIPTGALAIIFAILSRIGKVKLRGTAITGIITGIIALSLNLILWGFMFVVALSISKPYLDKMDSPEYLEEFRNKSYEEIYDEMYNDIYNEMYNDLYDNNLYDNNSQYYPEDSYPYIMEDYQDEDL